MPPPLRKRRPAKGAYPTEEDWEQDLADRPVADKKVRRVRRDQERAAQLRADGADGARPDDGPAAPTS